MTDKKIKFFKNFPFVSIAIICSIVYWLYLAATSQMILEHDAIGYESLGTLIYEKGLIEYIKTGPNREPLYPLSVAFSKSLENKLAINYQAIQMFLQIFILLITQFLMLKILRKLKVNNFLNALAILYIGISPAIVNSVFRLYSEIVTYPLMLMIVYFSFKSWQSLQNAERKKIYFYAFLLGISFALMTFVKGIFEVIAPLYLFCLFIFALLGQFPVMPAKAGIQRWTPAFAGVTCFRHTMIFLLISSLFFFIPINLYKYANKKLNGNFTLTDRGSYALYGNTTRRVEKLSSRQLLSALAYSVNWRFCNARFTPDECAFWSFTKSDAIGMSKSQELRNTMSAEQTDKTLIQLSIKKVFENPGQYALLTGIESLKMLFWESPSMQYVFYPNLVIKIYSYKPLNRALYIVMPFLTFAAILLTSFYLFRNRKFIKEKAEPILFILISIMTLIVCYVFIYSFFLILDRYSFPLVPLYLILIVFSLQQIWKHLRLKNPRAQV